MGVLAVATALRPSIVTVGPVLPGLQRELGLSAVAAATLTALPVLCFGIAAFVGPVLSARLGLDRALTASMALLTLGALARVLDGTPLLFVGTAVVGASIAVGNVLLPALVRRDFPHQVGLVTGLYTSTLAVTSSVAAGIAVPLAHYFGGSWRGPFAIWGAAAGVALLLWVPPHLRARTASSSGRAATRPVLSLLRSGTVRGLTAYMGLQAIGFYTLVAWLPTLLQDNGISAPSAGALLSLATVTGIPAGLLVPTLAGRFRQQGALAVALSALTAVGWAGLLVAPTTATILWIVLLGVGTGSTFPLALVLIALRSGDPAVTPQLSAVVQGFGYLIAAAGPLLIGILHGTFNHWDLPLMTLLVLCGAQMVSGWVAGRAETV